MYRILTSLVFLVAILLRLFLSWENPPNNSFDNHYEPISYIVQTGNIPPKDACFQCYHPPVFYYSSAIVARTLENLGLNYTSIPESLQFLNCIYGILTIIVLYLILGRFPLSEKTRLIAFSIICFLPRHIFMSAIHSNDCLTYLSISLCVYLLLVTIDRQLSLSHSGLLGFTITIAIFVKYTAFIVLPMVAIPLLTLAIAKSDIPRSKSVGAILLVLLPPLFLLGIYMADNYREYGRMLPWNDSVVNTSIEHPRDPGGVSFVSFTPWKYIKEPIIIPGQMNSFWTLIYSGMWVDNEPKFTYYTNRNNDWWGQYFTWLRGNASFPSTSIPISNSTRMTMAGLLTCGLIPLGFMVIGLARCALAGIPCYNSRRPNEIAKFQAIIIIFICNTLGIVFLVLKAPVYSSMKASYLLNSLPSFSVFIALGIQYIEKIKWVNALSITACLAIVALSSLYIFQIIWALYYFVEGH